MSSDFLDSKMNLITLLFLKTSVDILNGIVNEPLLWKFSTLLMEPSEAYLPANSFWNLYSAIMIDHKPHTFVTGINIVNCI